MAKINLNLIVLCLLIVSCSQKMTEADTDKTGFSSKKIIAYIAGWREVDMNQIEAEKITHINYAFANVVDGVVIEGEGREQKDLENLKKLHLLKKSNPDLKILISIGGWTWSGGFSDAVLTEASRKKFTHSAIDYLIRHDLDGLDFDWEYPGLPGNDNTFRAEDRENFVLMLQSVREALDSLGKVNNAYYLNTIASAGFKTYLDVNDLGKAQKYLDFINIMTYDFIGEWNDTTGHHSNLFHPNPDGRSAERAVLDHVEAGVPIDKLVMGMAFYGRAWKDVNKEKSGLHQNGSGWKSFAYHEIVKLMENPDFERKWDELAKAPFLWNEKERVFITYEDPASISAKTEFIKNMGMGGAMFWEYSEDHNGILLNAVNHGLVP